MAEQKKTVFTIKAPTPAFLQLKGVEILNAHHISLDGAFPQRWHVGRVVIPTNASKDTALLATSTRVYPPQPAIKPESQSSASDKAWKKRRDFHFKLKRANETRELKLIPHTVHSGNDKWKFETTGANKAVYEGSTIMGSEDANYMLLIGQGFEFTAVPVDVLSIRKSSARATLSLEQAEDLMSNKVGKWLARQKGALGKLIAEGGVGGEAAAASAVAKDPDDDVFGDEDDDEDKKAGGGADGDEAAGADAEATPAKTARRRKKFAAPGALSPALRCRLGDADIDFSEKFADDEGLDGRRSEEEEASGSESDDDPAEPAVAKEDEDEVEKAARQEKLKGDEEAKLRKLVDRDRDSASESEDDDEDDEEEAVDPDGLVGLGGCGAGLCEGGVQDEAQLSGESGDDSSESSDAPPAKKAADTAKKHARGTTEEVAQTPAKRQKQGNRTLGVARLPPTAPRVKPQPSQQPSAASAPAGQGSEGPAALSAELIRQCFSAQKRISINDLSIWLAARGVDVKAEQRQLQLLEICKAICKRDKDGKLFLK